MTEVRQNRTLLLLFMTPFLIMPWTTVHVHLAEQHNHDRAYHQHQVEIHAQHFVSLHVAANDFSHQASHANVIELDHEYCLSKREKQKNPSAAVVTPVFQPPPSSLLVGIKIPVIINTKLSYFDRSPVNPRAPPQTS